MPGVSQGKRITFLTFFIKEIFYSCNPGVWGIGGRKGAVPVLAFLPSSQSGGETSEIQVFPQNKGKFQKGKD
jgi:hypothetical protein